MSNTYLLERMLRKHGYEKYGVCQKADIFYKYDMPEEQQKSIVIIDAMRTECKVNKQVAFFKTAAMKTIHGLESKDVLVIIYGFKGDVNITSNNVILLNTDGTKIENRQLDEKFCEEKQIVKKCIAIARQQQKQACADTASLEHKTDYMNILPWVLLVVNVLIFANTILDGNSIYGISTNSVLYNGESYRLVTYMFLHNNIRHLVSNSIALIYIGSVFVKRVGNIDFAIVYFTGGIIAGYTSCYMGIVGLRSENVITVGASGAIFALLGALTCNTVMDNDIENKGIIKYCLLTLVISNISPNVDRACHIGGFVTGGIVMLILYLVNEIHVDRIYVKAKKKQKETELRA